MRKSSYPFPISSVTASGAIRAGTVMVLVSAMSWAPVSPAAASGAYTVPESGLSFDATDTVETDVCTTGYGNVLTDEEGDPLVDWEGDPFTEDDEINFLVATEFVTYQNVANIDGDAIDAKVTVTAITGMEFGPEDSDRDAAPTLDRLDKCTDPDDDPELLELKFESDTAEPGEANFVITIDFLSGGDPVTLNNLKMNVEDIDSNQFLEVDDFTSVRLADDRSASDVQEYANGETIDVDGVPVAVTNETASARRYHASGSSGDFGDPILELDKHVVEVTYASTQSIVLKLGAYEDGGGSFDLNFRGFTFASDSEGSGGSGSSNEVEASNQQGIHLDLLASPGSRVDATSALIEGQGLLPGSTYALRLGPGGQSLKSDQVSSGGRFSHEIPLPPGLAPGTYVVELSAIGLDGASLVLHQYFTVGAGGVITQVLPGKPGTSFSGSLAATGPDAALTLSLGAAVALLLLGGLSVALSRTRRFSTR